MVKNRFMSGLYMSKKGSSHFEIIASFILFTSFTLFLVLSLEPTKQDLLQESILFGVSDAFFNSIKTNVTSVLVVVSSPSADGCPDGLDSACVPEELKGSSSFYSEKKKECTYYVSASNEFSSSLAACGSEKKYSLGYLERQEVVSNKTLYNMRNEYYDNYTLSKNRFGVPDVVDFAVIVDGTDFAMQRTIPDEAEVISGIYRKRVIYSNGSIVNQDFIVKVW